MEKTKKSSARINIVTKLKIVTSIVLLLIFIIVSSLLITQKSKMPNILITKSDIYIAALPYSANRTYINNSTIVFDGDMKNSKEILIINPQIIPNGEYVPLDINPNVVVEIIKSTVAMSNFFPENVEISKVSPVEYATRPAIEFTFKFDKYDGKGYYFMANEYAFTVLRFIEENNRSRWKFNDFEHLNFLQLQDNYRLPKRRVPIINSATQKTSGSKIKDIKARLDVAHQLYNSRNIIPENLIIAAQIFEKEFKNIAEIDEVNLLTEKDRTTYDAIQEERKERFEEFKKRINFEFVKGNYPRVIQIMDEMIANAQLEGDYQWREWVNVNKQIILKKMNPDE